MFNRTPKQNISKAVRLLKVVIVIVISCRVLAVVSGVAALALLFLVVEGFADIPKHSIVIVVVVFCLSCGFGGIKHRAGGIVEGIQLKDMIVDYKMMKKEMERYR